MTQQEASDSAEVREQRWGLVVLLVGCAAVALTSIGFPPRARIYPLFIGAAGAILASAELLTMRRPTAVPARDRVSLPRAFLDILPYLGWLVAYLLSIGLVGFVLASGCFVGLFLHREGKVSRVMAGTSFVGVCTFLIVAGLAFGLHWPASVVDPFRWLGFL